MRETNEASSSCPNQTRDRVSDRGKAFFAIARLIAFDVTAKTIRERKPVPRHRKTAYRELVSDELVEFVERLTRRMSRFFWRRRDFYK